jgi:hypothetical protein
MASSRGHGGRPAYRRSGAGFAACPRIAEAPRTRPGPGVYRVTVRGVPPTGVQVSPLTSVVLVWPTEAELGPLDQP